MQSKRKHTGSKIFGNKMRRLRNMAGYSQTDLAKLIQVGGSGVISQVETGKISFTRKRIQRLADALGVNEYVLTSKSNYTDADLRRSLKFFEIMHTPKHPLRTALNSILDIED